MATSGIGVSPELTQAFASALEPHSTVRFIKISIENETLVASESIESSGSLQEDLPILQDILQDATPAYVLAKLDAPDVGWLAVSYVPDDAKVRDKMLYASTRNALTKSLGAAQFADALFATSKSDLTPEAYAAHRRHTTAPAPLSAQEKERAEAAAAERDAGQTVYQGAGERRSHVGGVGGTVGIAWSQEAEDGVVKLVGEEGSYAIVLTIDIATETLTVLSSQSVEADQLGSVIPSSDASYTLFSWPNSGLPTRDIVFIYACPSTTPVKHRMIYSSAVGILYRQIAGLVSSTTTTTTISSHSPDTPPEPMAKLHPRKVETSEPHEIDGAFLADEIGRTATDASPASLGGGAGAGASAATGDAVGSAGGSGAAIPSGVVGDGGQKPFARPRGPGRKR